MIAGFDNQMLSRFPARHVIPPFLRALQLHWPKAHIDVQDEHTDRLTRYRNGRLPETLPPAGLVHIVRDEMMALHFENNGASLDRTGEGPLTLFYWPGQRGHHNYNLVTAGRPRDNRFSRTALLLLIEIARAKLAPLPDETSMKAPATIRFEDEIPATQRSVA